MKTRQTTLVMQGVIASVIFFTALSGVSSAEEYFDRYDLSPASLSIDFGIQPLSYPAGVVGAVLRHDRILSKVLAESRHPLKMHPFVRGGDMLNLLADKRLECGIFGDVPTILSASQGKVWIIGLFAQASTGIVAKGEIETQNLAGKRIGYVEASTAHHTLMQGLKSVKLGEADVTLVPMRVNEMPDALEQGKIDAFAGWEPATTVALRNNRNNRIVFRGVSSDYFVLEKDFVKRSPEAAFHVVAGLLRAIEWMRRSQNNIETAVRWAMEDSKAFSGKSESLPVAEIVSITRRNLLNIPSAPSIVHTPKTPLFKIQFQFLATLGKLPATATWKNIETSFIYNPIAEVIAEQEKFKVGVFDYGD